MGRGWNVLRCPVHLNELAKSTTCRTYASTRSRTGARSIYTCTSARSYGFGSNVNSGYQEKHEGSETHWRQTVLGGSRTGYDAGNTSFLPVPFVTEQLAGAHHSTDLFSRLLKERIVAVYGGILISTSIFYMVLTTARTCRRSHGSNYNSFPSLPRIRV